MALPDGISTARVFLDAPLSFIGGEGRIHARISPSVPVVWEATGTPIGNFVDTIFLDPGVELSVHLPHTDQPGFLDGNGSNITGWYYRLEVSYEKDGQTVVFPARDFQLAVGQTNVDLALIPTGEASPVPQTAPMGSVTSVDGYTGAVTMEELGLDKVDNTADVDKPVSAAVQAALNALVKGSVGLGNVDNTRDVDKPVSVPQQEALNLKAPLNSPTFTGTVSGVTKSHVGLGNVDNTSDASKPVSTATQNALNGKAASTHRHNYSEIDGTIPTSALPPLAINDVFAPVASEAAMLALVAQRGDMAIRSDNGRTYVLAADEPGVLANWKEISAAGQVVSVAGKTGTVLLGKNDVGLNLVDNTTDLNKPVSTATQTALNGKANSTHTHTAANITDASTLGRSLMTAATTLAAQTAIGLQVTEQKLTLSNGWSDVNSSGWNGVWMYEFGNFILISGAGLKASWVAGELVANLPAGKYPRRKSAGANCEVADGGLYIGPAGNSAASFAVLYVKA